MPWFDFSDRKLKKLEDILLNSVKHGYGVPCSCVQKNDICHYNTLLQKVFKINQNR